MSLVIIGETIGVLLLTIGILWLLLLIGIMLSIGIWIIMLSVGIWIIAILLLPLLRPLLLPLLLLIIAILLLLLRIAIWLLLLLPKLASNLHLLVCPALQLLLPLPLVASYCSNRQRSFSLNLGLDLVSLHLRQVWIVHLLLEPLDLHISLLITQGNLVVELLIGVSTKLDLNLVQCCLCLIVLTDTRLLETRSITLLGITLLGITWLGIRCLPIGCLAMVAVGGWSEG